MKDNKEEIETLTEENSKAKSCNDCQCHEKENVCKCGDDCQCHEKDKSSKKEKKEKKDKLKEEIEKLKKENEELTNRVKASQAELINYRKRKDEEVEILLKYANKDLISELIQVVDNFERAIKHDDNDLTDELSKFLDGFKMMYANLTEILRKFGVEEINRVGQAFDPSLEQALMTDSVEEMDDDIVIEVLLKGYKLKDRVIRPASVKINQK